MYFFFFSYLYLSSSTDYCGKKEQVKNNNSVIQPRPQGFSLTHFLREKPWGRGWASSQTDLIPWYKINHSISAFWTQASLGVYSL